MSRFGIAAVLVFGFALQSTLVRCHAQLIEAVVTTTATITAQKPIGDALTELTGTVVTTKWSAALVEVTVGDHTYCTLASPAGKWSMIVARPDAKPDPKAEAKPEPKPTVKAWPIQLPVAAKPSR